MTRKGDVTPPEVRFWRFVRKLPNGGCWLWTGGTSGRKSDKQRGYGRFRIGATGSKQVAAHRYSWELSGRDAPGDAYLLHRCDTPSCVNPDHLFLGDAADNARDAVSKKRMKGLFVKGHVPRRESVPAKLNEEQVMLIRADKRPARFFASQFGVSISTIHYARSGKTWRHI